MTDAGKRGVFVASLRGLLRMELNETALDELAWKDLGPGLRIATVHKAEGTRLVAYRIAADAPPDVFAKHRHPGGEVYLMVKGELQDHLGLYRAGDLVYLRPGSAHTPRAIGETVILVLWPEAVELVDDPGSS